MRLIFVPLPSSLNLMPPPASLQSVVCFFFFFSLNSFPPFLSGSLCHIWDYPQIHHITLLHFENLDHSATDKQLFEKTGQEQRSNDGHFWGDSRIPTSPNVWCVLRWVRGYHGRFHRHLFFFLGRFSCSLLLFLNWKWV